MASKRVWRWSRILISSSNWSCMQNEKTLPSIGNIYHFEEFFITINNLESLLQTHHWLAEIKFQSSDCMKNEEFFQYLSTVDLGIVGKVSSRAIDYKWNHGNPTIGLPKISSRKHRQSNAFKPHRRQSSVVFLHYRCCAMVGALWSQWVDACTSWKP